MTAIGDYLEFCTDKKRTEMIDARGEILGMLLEKKLVDTLGLDQATWRSYVTKLVQPCDMEVVIRDILKERKRQDEKWGQQNHNPAEWVPILGEEYGELCKEVNECYFANVKASPNLYKEACETAAVAVAIMECCRRNGWTESGESTSPETASWR